MRPAHPRNKLSPILKYIMAIALSVCRTNARKGKRSFVKSVTLLMFRLPIDRLKVLVHLNM